MSPFHRTSGFYGSTRGETKLSLPSLPFFRGERTAPLQQVQIFRGRSGHRRNLSAGGANGSACLCLAEDVITSLIFKFVLLAPLAGLGFSTCSADSQQPATPRNMICERRALSNLGKKALENRFPRSFPACHAAKGQMCVFLSAVVRFLGFG